MKLNEALEIVYDLAEQGALNPIDEEGALYKEAIRQQEALGVVHDFHINVVCEGRENETVTLIVEGGIVQDVQGIPPGLTVEVRDYDVEPDEDHPSIETEEDGTLVAVHVWEYKEPEEVEMVMELSDPDDEPEPPPPSSPNPRKEYRHDDTK